MRIQRIITDREWQLAQAVSAAAQMEKFTPEQLREIRTWVTERTKRQRQHWLVHNTLNFSILVFLFIADGVVLIGSGWAQLSPIAHPLLFMMALIAGSLLHGFIAYSVVNYSLHEGAAHESIIYTRGPMTRVLNSLANNSCRVFFADPLFYGDNHRLHHQKFATRDDGAFSNFVSRRRIFRSLLPLALIFDFADYKIHSDMGFSWSRFASGVLSTIYILGYLALAWRLGDWILPALILLFFGPWFGFALDRLRETSEHGLMPLDYFNGSRNLGVGFWAYLIGGGPWGQPCHLSHHLGAHLAWYNQIALHRELMRLMTPAQKKVFTIGEGAWAFPVFFIELLRRIKLWEST